MASKLDYARFSSEAYEEKRNVFEVGLRKDGWSLIAEKGSSGEGGFHARAWKNEQSGEVVIAYEGTNLKDYKDFLTDIDIVAGHLTVSSSEALSFYENVKDNNQGSEISVTGHSLGGALAYIVASETGCYAETFNNPGIVGIMVTDSNGNTFEVDKADNVIENLSMGDVISMYGTHGENVEYANPDPFKITLKNAVHDAENGEEDFSELRNRYLFLGYHGINQWVEYLKNDNNTLTLDAESLKPYLDAYTAMQTAITDIQKGSTQTISLNGTKAIRPYTLAENLLSPIVLDLNGDGIITSYVLDNYVNFDLNADGFLARAA